MLPTEMFQWEGAQCALTTPTVGRPSGLLGPPTCHASVPVTLNLPSATAKSPRARDLEVVQ